MFIPDLHVPILFDLKADVPDLRRHELVAGVRKHTSSVGRYIVGASGGRDSLALSVALRIIVDHPSQVCMCHVNHGLRPDAHIDEATARIQAWALGFEFVSRSVIVPKTGNVYEQGRMVRYEALSAEADNFGGEVLTAHHADDMLETVLMRLARGSPISTSRFIERRSFMFKSPVVRPMLDFDRDVIDDFVTKARVPWVDDPSNQNTCRERAYLRRMVTPHLKAYRSVFASKTARSILRD